MINEIGYIWNNYEVVVKKNPIISTGKEKSLIIPRDMEIEYAN